MSDLAGRTALLSEKWLLFLHQLPAKPAYQRVKLWRRLQSLGAVAVKNAVYALPASEQSLEDFQWLLREVREAGGEAALCEARLIDGLDDGEVRALFNYARGDDYAEVAKEAREHLATLAKGDMAPELRSEMADRLLRLKVRLEEVGMIDFFGATGREAADGLLIGLEKALAGSPSARDGRTAPQPAALDQLKGRRWVTRQGVYVDRIACAWLIRHFIDDGAEFKFVPPRGYVPEPGELRFDMFAGEFTHDGDRCSFEVLLEHAALDDAGLKAIAEIVHDIDLKDDKFRREETAGVRTIVNGIAMASRDDEDRIAKGAAMFDQLYAFFRKGRRQ